MKESNTSSGLFKWHTIGISRITKRNVIIEIVSALFILLFLYTALSKSFNIGSTENALKKTPGFSNYATEVAWGIVVVEYVIAGLLFFPKTRMFGLLSSLFLMTAFTGYIAYMKSFVPNLPCSCGGIISKMTWNQHLVFNIFFTILAFVTILFVRKKIKSNTELESVPVIFT